MAVRKIACFQSLRFYALAMQKICRIKATQEIECRSWNEKKREMCLTKAGFLLFNNVTMDASFDQHKDPHIYIFSGGKGLPTNSIVQSLLVQFPDNNIPIKIIPAPP